MGSRPCIVYLLGGRPEVVGQGDEESRKDICAVKGGQIDTISSSDDDDEA